MLQNILFVLKVHIKKGRISLQKEEKIQEVSRLELNEILKGNPNYKSEDQISTTKNIKKLYNERLLINFITIILEWYLRLNTNQFMEKESKY